MRRTSLVRNAGLMALFGALIWIAALLVEYAFGLFPPNSGPLFLMNEGMFLAGQICYLGGIIGVIRSGAPGSGVSGRIGSGMLMIGQILLVIGSIAAIYTGSNELITGYHKCDPSFFSSLSLVYVQVIGRACAL